MRRLAASALAARWNGTARYHASVRTTGELRFEILGPLRVIGDDVEVPVSGAKRRALLLRLLVDANRPVAAETLVEDLWEGAPPPSASATLHSHISHLRRAVGSQLRTAPPGYAIDVADEGLDAVVFEGAVARARQLVASDPREAVRVLDGAQRLWRGVPLADVAGAAWAVAESARLEEVRLVAVECDLEARLALGDHAEVAARAEAAVAPHPLRERLWGFLITALYRDGRQADALRAYERLRRLLADELGINPSPELQALERAVLAQDASLGHERDAHEVTRSLRGVATFLMTDVVGSTRMWETAPDTMKEAIARHDEILRGVIAEHGGRVFATGGDGVAAAFSAAADAASAAMDAQARFAQEPWPEPVAITVRMGLHTGHAQERDGDFFGPTLNRCARVMAVAHGGQVLCTAATAELLRDDPSFALADLGSHRLRDLLAAVSVFQVGGGRFPPLRSLANAPSNLPTVVTDLVGRDDELASVTAEVRTHRILTLTGAGGVGKTRLALAVGAVLATEFFDGAWVVELAPAADSGDVVAAVTTALGAPATPGPDALSSLLGFLADRRLVLILDNCEHVLEHAASLATALVSSTADVQVLATSREPLGVDGEVVRRVRSLEVPDEDTPAGEATRVAAVRLFLDRARAADEAFALDDKNVAAVSTICRRLDGVPLALELAAARVRTMSVEEVARRLDDRFRVLTGARRSQERHRTLLATVAWSYDLLTPSEQGVFAQLSVFASTFDLPAASSVVSVEGLVADDVVDAVVGLVDRSLVVYEPVSRRYRLLETLRQFGADRLAETGEAEAVLARYVDHYLAFVERVGPAIGDHRHDDAVVALTADLDNVRATVDALARAGRWEDIGRLALAGWQFFAQFTPGETNEWFALALDNGGVPDPQDRADAAAAMALMAANVGAIEEATHHAEHALDAARRHGLAEPGLAYLALSIVTSFLEDWPATLRHAEAAVDAASARGDEVVRIVALAQAALGLVRKGRIDDADTAASEALEAAVRLRNGTALTGALSCICAAYVQSGDDAELQRALVFIDRYADALPWPPHGLNRAWLLTHRAIVEARRDPWRAMSYGVEAVRCADRTSPYALTGAIEALALPCAHADRIPEARALAAYARTHRVTGLDSSVPDWVSRATDGALGAGDDQIVAVPQSRRDLMRLLAVIDDAVAAPPASRGHLAQGT